MTLFDALTPDDLHAYLTSRGWEEEDDIPVSSAWRRYVMGVGAVIDVPCETHWTDYGRRVSEALAIVAEVEGRPTPAEQVAASVAEYARGGQR